MPATRSRAVVAAMEVEGVVRSASAGTDGAAVGATELIIVQDSPSE